MNKLLCTLLIAFFSLIALVIGIGVFDSLELDVVNREEAKYKIIDMTVELSKSSSEYSVYTIDLGDSKHYVLPSVPTKLVRNYYIGDEIPVIVKTHKDGSRSMEINKSAL